MKLISVKGLEQWRPIPGFEDSYEVSTEGEVRSIPRVVQYRDGRTRSYKGQLLRTSDNGYGYRVVTLSRGKLSRGLGLFTNW